MGGYIPIIFQIKQICLFLEFFFTILSTLLLLYNSSNRILWSGLVVQVEAASGSFLPRRRDEREESEEALIPDLCHLSWEQKTASSTVRPSAHTHALTPSAAHPHPGSQCQPSPRHVSVSPAAVRNAKQTKVKPEIKGWRLAYQVLCHDHQLCGSGLLLFTLNFHLHTPSPFDLPSPPPARRSQPHTYAKYGVYVCLFFQIQRFVWFNLGTQ